MANVTIEKQLDQTLRIFLTILTEPRFSINKIAKVTGASPRYVKHILMASSNIGLDFEYDHEKRQFVGRILDKLHDSILGEYARRLKKIAVAEPQVKLVMSLHTYTVREWATYMKTSPQNVLNMITGYKGQRLPAGWVAYRFSDAGKWSIMRMQKGHDGVYRLPDQVKTSANYRIGEGSESPKKVKAGVCQEISERCPNPVLAKGLCRKHYYRAKRAEGATE